MRFTTPRECAFAEFPRRPIACARKFLLQVPPEFEMPEETIRCDACPVLCYIKRGMSGACDRYANHEGQLVRVDPHVVLDRAKSHGTPLVRFLGPDRDWDGTLVKGPGTFVTAIGAGTTYPDYKPAPFIVSSEV